MDKPDPKARTLSRARAFVMPFGKHRGDTLGQIEKSDLTYFNFLDECHDLSEPLNTFVRAIYKDREQDIIRDLNSTGRW